MSYSQLPLEIWKEISLVDHRTYYVLVHCCKQFTLDQDYVKSLFIRTYIDKDKNIVTKLPNGWLHSCNDIPAKVSVLDSKYWYRNDKLYRDNDMAAIIAHDGYRAWYINDKCHRDNDLPARMWPNGVHQRTIIQKNNN
jgi:hypothetical protein